MKRPCRAQCAGWLVILLGLFPGACSHTHRDSSEPSVSTQTIADAVGSTIDAASLGLTFQARTVFTHRSGTQESFTLLCQLVPARKRIDLWLVSDFGASAFHGFATLGGESGIRSNLTSLSKTRMEHLLLIPLAHTLHLSLLSGETRSIIFNLPHAGDDGQMQPKSFILENGSRSVRITLNGSMTDPEDHFMFPSNILISGSSSDPGITISILSISTS